MQTKRHSNTDYEFDYYVRKYFDLKLRTREFALINWGFIKLLDGIDERNHVFLSGPNNAVLFGLQGVTNYLTSSSRVQTSGVNTFIQGQTLATGAQHGIFSRFPYKLLLKTIADREAKSERCSIKHRSIHFLSHFQILGGTTSVGTACGAGFSANERGGVLVVPSKTSIHNNLNTNTISESSLRTALRCILSIS